MGMCVCVCVGYMRVHGRDGRDLNKHYVIHMFVKYFTFISYFDHYSNPMQKIPLYSFFR